MSDKRRKAKRLAQAIQQLHPITRALAHMEFIMRPTINRFAREALTQMTQLQSAYTKQANSFMKEYEAGQ
jgi:hypothetical protein